MMSPNLATWNLVMGKGLCNVANADVDTHGIHWKEVC